MNTKRSSYFGFKNSKKAPATLVVLAIYLFAGFFSLRTFAAEPENMHMAPDVLDAILADQPSDKAYQEQKPLNKVTLNKNLSEKVAKQAAKLVAAQSSLQVQTTPAEAEIDHCMTGECNNASWVKDAKYEQCNSRNNYLEKRLENLDNSSPLFHFLSKEQPELKQVIKPNCVQAFMEAKGAGTAGGIYRACTPDAGVTSHKVPRACLSERYVNLTANSFNLAASCLKNIPNHIKNVAAKVYPQESGFHVNAMNPMRNDAGSGIGQLTNIAIEDVNRNTIETTRNTLATSDDSNCRAIATEFMQEKNPMKSSSALACNRLNVEQGNPLLNIIYSMSLLYMQQKSLDLNTFNDPRYASRFDLNNQELNKVKEAVLTWAYNAGQTVATPVKIVLDDYYSDKPVTDMKLFLVQVESAIYSYKRAKNIKRGRKNPGAMAHINSRYYSEINKDFDLIDKNLEGGKCLLNQ